MRTQKKVLMLHGSSDLYGASKIFLESVRAILQNGHQVIVVLSEDGPLVEFLMAYGIKVHLFKLGIIRRKYFNPPGIFNRILCIRKAKILLEEIIKTEGITHLYSNTSAVLVGAFVRRSSKVIHIWHLHEILLQPTWFVKILGYLIRKKADRVIVVSQAVKEHWQKFMPTQHINLVYNGISYEPYLNSKAAELTFVPKDKLLIGMIGRVNHWKGQGYFLDIAKELLHTNKSLHFVLAGDAFPGTEQMVTELEERIKNEGLSENVSFLGFRDDIPELLQRMDIFVLPSILPDPFPTVILEAMASAKPVVATRHGGACEMLIDGQTGYLIPWEDAKESAKLILNLIHDAQLRAEMGKKGRLRVLQSFSKEAFCQNFLAAIV
jgi:glycosyltransferase involved in cell wall biosynthesis